MCRPDGVPPNALFYPGGPPSCEGQAGRVLGRNGLSFLSGSDGPATGVLRLFRQYGLSGRTAPVPDRFFLF